MSKEKQVNETTASQMVSVAGDENYYEALYQIIQDAQAAGSVVQIVTIWPNTQADGEQSDGIRTESTDCKPSGACPK